MVRAIEPELPRTDVSGSEFEVGAPTSEEEAERKKRVGQNALQRVLSRLFLRVGYSLFYIAGFNHISGSFPVYFQVMPKRFRESPETKMCRLAWRLMGSCGGVT